MRVDNIGPQWVASVWRNSFIGTLSQMFEKLAYAFKSTAYQNLPELCYVR